MQLQFFVGCAKLAGFIVGAKLFSFLFMSSPSPFNLAISVFFVKIVPGSNFFFVKIVICSCVHFLDEILTRLYFRPD